MITLAFWSYLLATTLYRKNNNTIVFYDLLKVIDLTKKYILIKVITDKIKLITRSPISKSCTHWTHRQSSEVVTGKMHLECVFQ